MRRKTGKAIIIFFAVILVCTLVSRGAKGALTAKVETDSVRKGSLSETVSGEGTVQAGETSCQFLPEGQKIKSLLVQAGSEVSEGQDIIQLDVEYMQSLIDNAQNDKEKLELQLKQQKIQGEATARTPATASAEITLNSAVRALQNAQNEYNAAVAKAQNFAAIPPAPDASEEDVAAWNQQLEELNSQARSLADQIQTQNEAYNQAVDQYHLAEQEEANEQANQAKTTQANGMAVESIQVDIDAAQAKIQKLQDIKDGGCVVKAGSAGILLDCGAQAGTITTGAEQIKIASGSLQVRGSVLAADAGKIAAGDEIQVTFAGKSKAFPVNVSQVMSAASDQTSDGADGKTNGTMYWYAQLTDSDAAIGASFTYVMTKTTDTYQKIIPLGALRESQGKKYVLTAEEKDGILGRNLTAVAVPVTLLAKDDKNAAIESVLDDTSKIIVSSNKYVEEGDPVRLEK